jgi:hypothetical protein
MYISCLVKTRDPYPGLLQITILFYSSFPSLPLFVIIFFFLFFFHLYSLIINLVEVLLRPFHSKDLVLASLVSENISHVLQATSVVQIRQTISKLLHCDS